MNLLEHYVEKIYSEKDITQEFEEKTAIEPYEKVYLVDMDVNCYGVMERVQKDMFETEYKLMKQNGYYMA